MIPNNLTRWHFFSFKNRRNTANFSMVCNCANIPNASNKPMTKYNETSRALQNKQQFRSFWHSRLLQNTYDDETYINLDHLWTAKPVIIEQNKRNKPKSGDWWTKPREEKNLGIAATTADEKCLAFKSIQYSGQQQRKWLNVQYLMGRSGQKFMQINRSFVGTRTDNFPKILVPQDVFAFVQAMDEVLKAVEANRNRIEAQTKANIPDQQQIVLHTAMAKGTKYNFELDLCLGRFSDVQMRTVANEQWPGHNPRFLIAPIGIFCWLRRAIGEVFVENGEPEVLQQLGKPPSLPGWLRGVIF